MSFEEANSFNLQDDDHYWALSVSQTCKTFKVAEALKK